MTQYNSLNVKLSNSQLNNLKSAIKIKTEIVLRLSSYITGNSDDETNFPYGQLMGKLEIFVRHLEIIHQLILSYQKLNYLR